MDAKSGKIDADVKDGISKTGKEESDLNGTKSEIIHRFSGKEVDSLFNKKIIIMLLVILILGIASGNILYNLKVPIFKTGIGINKNSSGLASNSSIESGQIFGSTDEKTFKDTAEGVMKTGGIDGEGEYHLERPGGVSQNVYLTSSVIDLSKFIDKKVKVWGETNSAKKAGWLMDVGRLQVE